MGAPALVFQVTTAVTTAASDPGAAWTVTASATSPAAVQIPAPLLERTTEELVFLVARAIDHLRGGFALVEQATSGTPDEIAALLQGVSAALDGTPRPDSPLGLAAANALGDPARAEAVRAYMESGGATFEDFEIAQDALESWESFREAAGRATDRFGLLAAASPRHALGALHAVAAPATGATGEAPDDGAARDERLAFLATAPVVELVTFMLSAAYADAPRTDVVG